MVDFGLSEDQQMLMKLAHDFAVREIVPVAAELDEAAQFPTDLIAKARKVGLINFNIPEQYGGMGASLFEECLIGEELAWGCSGVSTSIVINNLAAIPIMLVGSEEQKKEWLGKMVEGMLASYAVTEPGAGSDVAGMSTRAERRDGEYVLTGSKTFISNASAADFFTVFARTSD